MFGWVAQFRDGQCLRENDGYKWNDINIHLLEKLWLESFEHFGLERDRYPAFLEFVQFKTGILDNRGNIQMESQCIGWTDGVNEMIYRMTPGLMVVTIEVQLRVHFHPLSIIKK